MPSTAHASRLKKSPQTPVTRIRMSLMLRFYFFVFTLLAFTTFVSAQHAHNVGDADADLDKDLVTNNVDADIVPIYSAADDAMEAAAEEEHRNHLRQRQVATSNTDVVEINDRSFDHQNDHLRSLSHPQDGEKDAREGDIKGGRKLGRKKRRRRRRFRPRRRRKKQKWKGKGGGGRGKKKYKKKKKYTQYDYPIGNCGGGGY